MPLHAMVIVGLVATLSFPRPPGANQIKCACSPIIGGKGRIGAQPGPATLRRQLAMILDSSLLFCFQLSCCVCFNFATFHPSVAA